ncbi:hypothetical protein ACIQUG_32480 [Ensifer sp. NPDC090286]|uniref:hypothetical protein n=1 Tax=Ensifer sp. NPDC090286 TaxID=3363991 RepID=UPI00383BB052
MSFSIMVACAFCTDALSQESGLGAEELSAGRIFHLKVHGKAQPDNNRPDRVGRAFAVSSNLLVAPGSIVGGGKDWLPAGSKGPAFEELERLSSPLDRSIVATATHEDLPLAKGESSRNIIVSGSSGDIDAIGLLVPDFSIEQPFTLSLCRIVPGNTYAALLAKGDPNSPDSLLHPDKVPVVAEGYDAADYGNLYAFRPEKTADIDVGKGLEGSPILNENGNVVAMVSLIVDIRGPVILATPISPQFPGTFSLLTKSLREQTVAGGAPDDAVQCSLNETVRKMYDRVAAQLTWTIEPRYRPVEEKINGKALRYEKLSQLWISYDEPPSYNQTVKEISVRAKFYGVSEPGGGIEPLELATDANAVLQLDEDATRSFNASRFVEQGITLLEKDTLKDCLNNGCGIRRITLYVKPTIDTEVWQEMSPSYSSNNTSVVRNIEWTRGR